MRRLAAALATLALSALLVVAPSLSASAAGPDPVIPLPYTPSQVASVLTGFADGSKVSEAYLKAYLLAYNAARNAGQSSTAASATAIAATPKPITAPAAIAKAGAPLVAFQAGWAIGQGGLALYAAATGSTYQDVLCSTTPDWYQSVNTFIMLSLPPSCAGLMSTPNIDQPEGVWSVGGGSWPLKSTSVQGQYWYCGPTVRLPAGQSIFYSMTNYAPGSYTNGDGAYSSNNSAQSAFCGLTGTNSFYRLVVNGTERLTGLQIRNSTTGAVLHEGVQAARADPNRTIGCTVTASNGQSYTATSGTYKESEGIPLRGASTACNNAWDAVPSGAIPTKISTESTLDGAKTTISEQNVNPGAIPAEAAPGGGGLVLEKVVGAGTQSCMDWTADCAEWWSETSSGTVTGLYRCLFGGVEVDLSQCSPYQQTFKSQTQTPTITDPLTGTTTPWAATPSPGNSLSPGVGPGVGPNPADTCFADGWASVANPIDWVLVPVKCALVWAFVPRLPVVEGTITGLGEAAGDVAAVDPLMALVDMLPAGGGCGGIPVSLTFFGQTATGNLLAACDGFGATAAAVVNGLLTLTVTTGALFAVTRYAAAVFGFVGPGGSFQQQEYSNAMMARSAARSD